MANLQLKMIGESVETCLVKVNRSFHVKCLSRLLWLRNLILSMSSIDQLKMFKINVTKHEGKGKLV